MNRLEEAAEEARAHSLPCRLHQSPCTRASPWIGNLQSRRPW